MRKLCGKKHRDDSNSGDNNRETFLADRIQQALRNDRRINVKKHCQVHVRQLMVGQSVKRELSIAIKTNMYIRFDISKIVGRSARAKRRNRFYLIGIKFIRRSRFLHF